MVLPDLHVPHHDSKALGCVLAAYHALKPRDVVILGDWLDCEAFSSYPRGSKLEDAAGDFFESEVQPVRKLLTEFEIHSKHLTFLEGNHEHRVERKLIELGDLGAALVGLVSPRRLLGQDRKRGWDYVPYVPKPGHPLPHARLAEDLIAVHGWTFCRHAAAKHLDIARSYSVVHGHTHRAQSYTAREPITGKVLRAWSPGCLTKLQPLYMAHVPTDWVHGFSLVWVSDCLKKWTEFSVLVKDGVAILPGGAKVTSRGWEDFLD